MLESAEDIANRLGKTADIEGIGTLISTGDISGLALNGDDGNSILRETPHPIAGTEEEEEEDMPFEDDTALENDQLAPFKASIEKAVPEVEVVWVRDSTGVITARFLAEDQSYGPVGVRAKFGVLDKVPKAVVFTPDTFWPQ